MRIRFARLSECPRIGPWRTDHFLSTSRPTYFPFTCSILSFLCSSYRTFAIRHSGEIGSFGINRVNTSRYLVAFARPYQTARALRASYVRHYASLEYMYIYAYVSRAEYMIEKYLTEVRTRQGMRYASF